MEDKFKKDVEVLIKAIFSEKEEAAMKQKTEEALQTSANTIDELATALEEKSADLLVKEETVATLTKTVDDLKSELEAAKLETSTVADKLAGVEAELEKMHKDKATEIRMSELEVAGIVRKDKEGQAAKVREMSDEEFASYRDELVSIREAVLAEMEAAKKEADEKAAVAAAEAKVKEEAATKAAAAADSSSNQAIGDTPPANIDPTKAVSAALNMEMAPSDDVKNKYNKLGQAMADMFKKSE
jgi:chromosome segregation ATPase